MIMTGTVAWGACSRSPDVKAGPAAEDGLTSELIPTIRDVVAHWAYCFAYLEGVSSWLSPPGGPY